MAKLNKATQYNMVIEAINKHIPNPDEAQNLIEALKFLKPKDSQKINDDGEIWCNYFETYLPADQFKTKMNSKKYKRLIEEGMPEEEATEAATGYQTNSIKANEIIRKTKSLKRKLEQQVMTEYRFGRVSEKELNEILDLADTYTENKFSSINDVPEIWDLIAPAGKDLSNVFKPE